MLINKLNRRRHYKRLKDLREENDLTQDELIKILDMHKTTHTNYEQGKREIPFCLVIKLAKLYNVTIDYIAEIADIPKEIDETKGNCYSNIRDII